MQSKEDYLGSGSGGSGMPRAVGAAMTRLVFSDRLKKTMVGFFLTGSGFLTGYKKPSSFLTFLH